MVSGSNRLAIGKLSKMAASIRLNSTRKSGSPDLGEYGAFSIEDGVLSCKSGNIYQKLIADLRGCRIMIVGNDDE